MLGKVLKYDLKQLLKLFTPLYLVFICITAFCLISKHIVTDNFAVNMLINLGWTSYGLGIAAILITTYIFIALHFYRKCVSSEAYLTFTLPVKRQTILWSKLLTAILFQVISYLIILGSILLVLDPSARRIFYDMIGELLNAVSQYNMYKIFIPFCVIMIVKLFSAPLMIYASMAVGQLSNQHKVGSSIGCYIGFYFAEQTFTFTVSAIIGSATVLFANHYQSVETLLRSFDHFAIILALISIIVAVIYYLLARILFAKKLNLQ